MWQESTFEEIRPNRMITPFEIGDRVVITSYGHRYSNRSGKIVEIEIGNGTRYGVMIDHEIVWFEEEEIRKRG